MYGGRGLPLRILVFLRLNSKKKKSKLKVKWNVTAKERKKKD